MTFDTSGTIFETRIDGDKMTMGLKISPEKAIVKEDRINVILGKSTTIERR